MSPRYAGAVLIVSSIGVGVLAGALIPDARWAIFAACLLTLATVGMAVGVLWMMRRSWADKTWPPAAAELPPGVRATRGMRNLGIVLLAPLPVAVAGLVWTLMEGGTPWYRLLVGVVFVLGYGAAGVWLVRAGRVSAAASLPRASHTQHPDADPASTTDLDGWRMLGSAAGPGLFIAASAPSGVLFVIVALQLLLALDEAPWGLFVWALAILVAAGLSYVFLRRAARRVSVDVEGRRIRVGRRTVPWTAITHAELFADPPWPGAARTLMLTLRDADGLRARLVLRRREVLGLSTEETDIAVRIIEGSSIALPRAKEDPRGRFSKQLFPNSLTKAESLAVVTEPPGMHDPLPIG